MKRYLSFFPILALTLFMPAGCSGEATQSATDPQNHRHCFHRQPLMTRRKQIREMRNLADPAQAKLQPSS